MPGNKRGAAIRNVVQRVRARLARVDTGHDFFDSCCHRIGGQWRAGPAPHRPR